MFHLFSIQKKRPKCYYFIIGRQNVIVVDATIYPKEVWYDKHIAFLMQYVSNVYWFSSFEEMEEELVDLMTVTDDDYYILIT